MARSFKGKTFTKILRGYAPDEVDEYIAYIDGEYQKLEKTSGDNTRRLALALRKLDEMNNYADQLEEQLDEQARQAEEQIAKQKRQLILAAKQLQKYAQQPAPDTSGIVEKAKKEAEMIVSDAQLQSEKIIAEAEELARSMREKIITEATAKAERIIVEAEAQISDNNRAAQDMRIAAVDIYNEIVAFRDTLFAAYNTHIEAIEEITDAAEVLLGEADESADGLADTDDVEADELADEPDEKLLEELPMDDIDLDGELEALGALAGLDDLKYLAGFEEIDSFDDEDLQQTIDADLEEEADVAEESICEPADAGFDVIEEAGVPVPDIEELDFYDVVDGETVSGDENGFVELNDASEADEEPVDIWAEYFAGESNETNAEEPTVEDEPQDIKEEPVDDYQDDEPAIPDTYESYEEYGEIEDDDDLDDTIEMAAQKYSTVYTDPLDDEEYDEDEIDDGEDTSYAPNDEYAWGDDMYAEPEEEATVEDESVEDEEMDELDKLKQFFSADYDEDLARERAYDTSSNSTTSIALSLNDFFEEGEDMTSDFSFDDEEGDMEALFEKDEDPMSVTDEFNIIFGKMDSAENVEEIRRQPIIPAEEPKNPKKHKKF